MFLPIIQIILWSINNCLWKYIKQWKIVIDLSNCSRVKPRVNHTNYYICWRYISIFSSIFNKNYCSNNAGAKIWPTTCEAIQPDWKWASLNSTAVFNSHTQVICRNRGSCWRFCHRRIEVGASKGGWGEDIYP